MLHFIRQHRLLCTVLTLTCILLTALLLGGEVLSAPAQRAIGAPPAGLHVQNVRIPLQDGTTVAGWFASGKPGNGAVLLLHGVRSNRLQMVARARLLQAEGYGILLIDLPAHGDSDGERITFGARESLAVNAALGWLHAQLPQEKTGVIGVSLGAASVVLANPRPNLDAVVLESMYPEISTAVENRLAIRLGPAGRALSPLLLWQLEWRLGIAPASLRPVAKISQLGAPLLLISGSEDRHTTQAETEHLFQAASEPKMLWIVPGAAHVDLQRFAPGDYASKVMPFLASYLKQPS